MYATFPSPTICKFCLIGDQRKLQNAKRYLTCEYQWHVQASSRVADHCINYALSDGSFPYLAHVCPHQHDEGCQYCTDMSKVLDEFEQIIIDASYPTEEIRTDYLHDFQNCRDKIWQWKQHILRTVNQGYAKEDILKNLKEDEVFIVMDWAMKFMPWIDREKQISLVKRG